MTIYSVEDANGVSIAYFLKADDAYAFIRYNYLYYHVESHTVAATFFTTGVNAVAAVDVGRTPFPA